MDELFCSSDSADEIYIIACAGVIDTEDWGENLLLKDANVECGNGVSVGRGHELDGIPFAIEIHACAAWAGRLWRGIRGEWSPFGDFGEELCGSEVV